jgi:hypothetical protein
MSLKAKPIRIQVVPPALGGAALNVPEIKQEQTQWCWAACAQMVLRFYGNGAVRQCEFANWLFGQSGCCQAPGTSLCNRPCQVTDVVRVYAAWAKTCSYVPSNVAFATLQAEINAGRPVEVGYRWNGGGGHVAIVCAWDINATGPFLRVNDPWYGSGGVYYSNLLTAYGLGSWQWTWIAIR